MSRPLTSADLGQFVDANVALAQRSAGAAFAAAGVHAWADQGVVSFTTTNLTDVLAVTVTPKVTGKLRLWYTGYPVGDGTSGTLTLAAGHGTPALAADYTSVAYTVPVSGTGSFSIFVDFASLGTPVTFAVGTAVRVGVAATASAGNHISLAAHGGQLIVQELLA